jgi:hypothetical protein
VAEKPLVFARRKMWLIDSFSAISISVSNYFRIFAA